MLSKNKFKMMIFRKVKNINALEANQIDKITMIIEILKRKIGKKIKIAFKIKQS
jgi:hypothetical protein